MSRRVLSVVLSFCIAFGPATQAFAPTASSAFASEAKRLIKAFDSIDEDAYASMQRDASLIQRTTNRIVGSLRGMVERIPVIGRAFRQQENTIFTEIDLKAFRENADVAEKVPRLFRYVIGFIQRLSDDASVDDDDRGELLEKVTTRAAMAFEELTDSYADASPEPPSWDAVARSSDNGFQTFLSWATGKALYLFDFVSRDIVRLMPFGRRSRRADLQWMWPNTNIVPFMSGKDERTTAAVEAIGRDLKFAVEAEMAQYGAVKPNTNLWIWEKMASAIKYRIDLAAGRATRVSPGDDEAKAAAMSLTALESLIRKTESSEPMKDGQAHSFVQRVYRFMAVYWFLTPPMEPFLERTTFSPLVAAIMWSGAMLMMAHARRENSGLKYTRTMLGSRLLRVLTFGLAGKGLLRRVDRFKAATGCAGEFSLD
ncbi:hypothetical protein K2X33_09795 [bacterium]|nr:hypothetical protein [bacterium]